MGDGDAMVVVRMAEYLFRASAARSGRLLLAAHCRLPQLPRNPPEVMLEGAGDVLARVGHVHLLRRALRYLWIQHHGSEADG